MASLESLTAIGAFAAIAFATAFTSSINLSASTTLFTSPILKASSALLFFVFRFPDAAEC
jgi:hypothetical protein